MRLKYPFALTFGMMIFFISVITLYADERWILFFLVGLFMIGFSIEGK